MDGAVITAEGRVIDKLPTLGDSGAGCPGLIVKSLAERCFVPLDLLPTALKTVSLHHDVITHVTAWWDYYMTEKVA